MIVYSTNWFAPIGLAMFVLCSNAHSAEYVIESNVSSQAAYNDNIFMTTEPHDSVTSISIAPTIKALVKEMHWNAGVNARIQNNNYSDDTLDSNDKLLSVNGNYKQERNIYSVDSAYRLYSNLDTSSEDFGLTGKRTDRRSLSFSPGYTRLISETLSFTTSLAYLDVDYFNSDNTNLTPYKLNTITGSLIYNISEIDQWSTIVQISDYKSNDGLIEYQLYVLRIGLDRMFTERLSGTFQAGASLRNSTDLRVSEYPYIGSIVLITQKIDSTNSGFVGNIGLSNKLENGAVSMNISRDDATDSAGGLSEVDKLLFKLNDKITELWRYTVNLSYSSSTTLSSDSQTSDREILTFSPAIYYSFNRKWSAAAAYTYTERRFKNDTSIASTPHSSAVMFGITYNFPSISTF